MFPIIKKKMCVKLSLNRFLAIYNEFYGTSGVLQNSTCADPIILENNTEMSFDYVQVFHVLFCPAPDLSIDSLIVQSMFVAMKPRISRLNGALHFIELVMKR